MLMYWLMFLLPVWGLFVPGRVKKSQQPFVWLLVWVFFTLVIGFRDHVGGDWYNYLRIFNSTLDLTVSDIVRLADPGYQLLSWIVAQLGGDVHWVNLVCAALVMYGTVQFCRRQPLPWLALLVAVPYLLLVVSMGYTRQSVAVGMALLALIALSDGRLRVFIMYVAIGALFHKSALLLLPMAVLAVEKNRLVTIAAVIVSAGFLYYLLVVDKSELLWNTYVTHAMHSEGGAFRVAMNGVPAVLMLIFGRRLAENSEARRLWTWMSVFALTSVPFLAIASTAVDRVALNFIPLQMFVFSRITRLTKSAPAKTVLVVGVVAYYAIEQAIWLIYSDYNPDWVPYRFMW